MSKKITEDQLKKIQKLQQTLSKHVTDLGALEVNKSVILAEFHKANKETEDYKKELEKEYGSVNINLADGTYEEIVEEAEEVKE